MDDRVTDAPGGDQANVGRRERPIVGRSERRIDVATRPDVEMEHEVRQRASAPSDAHEPVEPESSHRLADDVPPGPQTSGYREDRENPAVGLGAIQSGEHMSQELPSAGFRRPRGPRPSSSPAQSPAPDAASSRPNVARESRPSR